MTNSSVLPELVEGLVRFQTQFTDDGWGGYGGVSSPRDQFPLLCAEYDQRDRHYDDTSVAKRYAVLGALLPRSCLRAKRIIIPG